MKKTVKVIASILGVIVLLAIFAAVLLVTLVNPNRFKPLIAEQVQKLTGRQLTIDGELSWSFYPYVGIKVGHMELGNPAGFKQKTFAELDSANIEVKLLPLLHAQIESSGVMLNGLILNLIKNVNGQTNWEDLQTSKTAASNTTQVATQTSSSKAAMVIMITGVDVSNAKINWIDESAKQQFTMDQFDLQAKDITFDRPFPVKTQFHFTGTNPVVSGQMNLSTNALLDVNKQFYQFKKTDFSAEIKQGGKQYKINTSANVVVDMQAQRAEVRNWQGDFSKIKWAGQLDVKNLNTQPYASGTVKLEPFALQEVLASLGQSTKDSPQANNVKVDMSFNLDTAKKMPSAMQELSMQGLITADDLLIKNIKATTLIAKTQLENGVFTFSSMSAVFYQGNLQSDATVNLMNTALPVTFNAKLVNVQSEQLIANLIGNNDSFKVKGIGNIELHVTTAVKDSSAILRNLNGNGKFSFSKGVLEGIDITYWADSAYALAKGQSNSGSDSNQTAFGSLTGTMNIHSGVIANDDLLLDMSRFTTNGNGTIDLVNQLINYSLKTKAKADPESRHNAGNLYGLTIPILVTGNLNRPKASLDMGDLTKQIGQQQVDKVKDKALEKIQQQLPAAGALLKNLLGK